MPPIPPQPYEAPLAVVKAALAPLADRTPEEIAAALQTQGIAGERGKCRTCPIAVLCTQALAAAGYPRYYVKVWSGSTWLMHEDTGSIRQVATLEHRPSLIRFLEAFDNDQQFPFLVTPLWRMSV